MCQRHTLDLVGLLQPLRNITGYYQIASICDGGYHRPDHELSSDHKLSQICWYLAAVVQIQLCKYFIEINDTARESTVWGEINVLR